MERRFILDTEQHRSNAASFVARINVSEPVEMILRPYTPQRTSAQNARLWKLHTLAAGVTGYTPDELHEEALCRFFGYEDKKMLGGWVKRIPLKRSSTRNRKEFASFMEVTEAFYVENLGVWLE